MLRMQALRIFTLLLWFTAGLRASEQLTQGDVQQIITQAISYAMHVDPHAVIAVVDREGFILGVWKVQASAAPADGVIAAAITRAGTGAFLSSNQNAFTSRTA